jgi:ABC-type lipoprotein release transport system permease subunit
MAVEETCEEMNASLFLAYKELEKAKLRNLLIVLSVSVGVMGVILVDSMQNGVIDDFKQKTIDIFTSHLQVLPAEDKEYVERAESKRRMIENISGVRGVTLRIETKALIGTEGQSRQVQILAIEPEREPDVTSLNTKIVEGQFLLPSDRTKVVLGKKLAEDVKVGVGENVTIVFPNGTGQQFKVGGLIDSGFYDFDNGVVLMPYRTLVEVGGKENIASSVVVRVQDESQVDAIALQVNQLTPQDKVETWVELSPYVQLILQTQNYRTMVSVTLILLTAGFSMISAMVIKVSSRTRYIGMTKAMGATGGFILATYLMQAAAIGMVGGILGDAWAYLGYSYLSTYQITVAGLEKTLGTATIPFHLNPSMYLSSFIFATVVCILSALYPAYRASRLEVTETVRHA